MKKITICLFALLVGSKVVGQDAQFSQYFSASLYLNPGFAGVYNDPTLQFNHKRQVPANEDIIELSQVSFIFPLKPQGKLEKAIGGVGLMAYTEKSGTFGTVENNGAFLTYAHNFKFGILTSDVFSVGIQVGYESRSVNFSKLNWGSQFNQFLGYDDSRAGAVSELNNQKNNLIINGGIMYSYNPERNYLLYSYSAFSGFSATNLNQPNRSFVVSDDVSTPILWKYNGGVELKLNKLFVTPSLFFQYFNQSMQFNAGILVSYAPQATRYQTSGPQLIAGTWYRYRDSFILMGGVKINSIVFRASYDLNTKLFFAEKNVDLLAKNSFELSVRYSLSKSTGNRKISNPLF